MTVIMSTCQSCKITNILNASVVLNATAFATCSLFKKDQSFTPRIIHTFDDD